MDPTLTIASLEHSGVICLVCGRDVVGGDELAVCPACGQSHHRACWSRSGACGSYECSTGRRDPGRADAPWVISSDELMAATVAAPRPGGAANAMPGARPGRAPMSRSAIAAAICAVAGIPMFGLVTGAVAVVLAAVSLSATADGRRRGAAIAGVAMILGLVDIVGWAYVLSRYLPRENGVAFETSVLGVSEADLAAASEEVAAALRANVVISRHGSLMSSTGSGVVLSVVGGGAQILTNRHVVDPSYRESGGAGSSVLGAAVEVRYIDGSSAEARITWLGPDGLDLAIVSAPVSGASVGAAAWEAGVEARIGADVFAIGNPGGLGWTHTPGSVSQLREHRVGGASVRIIQTSAPINPGNSGGGLYDAQGRLIGINTWSADKRTSEGLGFAISLAPLEHLRAQWLGAAAAAQEGPP